MSEQRRVLIVEDSATMRQLLAYALQRLRGVVVDQAEDGVAALKALAASQSRPYDLVLLDINMPVMDGIKLLSKIKQDPALQGTTVCVITTDETNETEVRARALGARFFLRKPVNRRSIERIVAEVFGTDLPPLRRG